jgi:hypothetical protein
MPTMPLPLKSISSIAERPHWTVMNGQATFAPVRGWRATVRRLKRPEGDNRYHVAIIDRMGAIRFTMETTSLDEAVRSAERGVLARNALRLVPRIGLE